ncbi:TonB-dependent receptor [Luteibaculum oceani]|uniref:TonB-dependent receptor n=1 Tax=Luteibaculum oceani TaxID=1294296 RepID=A0A5C6V324_9FLAO|nr:TonB-dependent receptor [Luteibaculum oceani]TXC78916.1 TonB-dependent receptor [Luteibaculum oceani]
MFLLRAFLVLCVTAVTTVAVGQSAIRGTVIDDATGETLIGVAVIIEGTTKGASTDLDGNFEIKAEPGTYNLKASFISFAPVTVKDVIVKEGEVTALGTIRLGASAEQLKEVVVTAKAVKNTEAALLTMKKKSTKVIDGISAASFKKIGDSDAASAMSRVTGVSVQGGKYVYVRGLGDRYTKTTLNGMDIPGLDPDRNTVQMDIFPTNVIDNIVVSKSFSAEQSADFTGGAVDITTKDFPEEKLMNVGVGVGFNPNMHFNSDYIKYNGGKTDFLGFDDGTRDIPTGRRTDIPMFTDAIGNPNGAKGQEYQDILRGFNPQMGGYRANSFMNTGVSLSYGDQTAIGERKIGYSFSLSYKNEYEFYEDAEFNLYGKAIDPNQNELTPLERQKGDYGVNNVLLGAMAGAAIKDGNTKYKVNLMHLQNGESKAGIFDFTANNLGTEFQARQYNIEYSERGLTNLLISGTTRNEGDNMLEWSVAPTRSYITDPDIRFLRFRDEGKGVSTESGLPERIWRFLEEYSIPAKVDVTRVVDFNGKETKVKFGASHTFKNRDFDIQGFQINPGDIDFNEKYNGNPQPEDVFSEENLYDSENPNGVRFNPTFIPRNPNQYNSFVHHSGVYGSAEYNFTPLLKSVIGLRAEMFKQFYTGTNQNGTINYNKENVINDFDLFPTVNLIYALNEDQNLRFSFSKTIARPSFKEMSFAEILDPISGRTFVGGLFSETSQDAQGNQITLWDGNLRSTRIYNFDMRWELFNGIGQNISASTFFKTFDAPIEIVQYLSDPGTFQARNVGNATVLGVEFEAVQSLNFISEKLKKFAFNTNVTVTKSQIKMSDSELASRRNSARTGEEIKDTRVMAGQAPYLINAGISFDDKEKALQASVFYNVQGRTLQFVGFANQADVYSVPFNSLNLKVSKGFGPDNKMNASFKVSNLLNDMKEKVFTGYNAQDQIFTRLAPGRTFSLGFSYTL